MGVNSPPWEARRLAGTAPSYLVRAAVSLVTRAGDAPDPSWGIGPSEETGEEGLCCGDALSDVEPAD